MLAESSTTELNQTHLRTIFDGVMGTSLLTKRLLIGGAALVGILVISAVGFALVTWGEVNRVSIDRPVDEAATPQAQSPGADEADDAGGDAGLEEARHGIDVMLLVGSDSREDLDDLRGFGEFEGKRADVVMVMIRTEVETAVLSLPRDLWIDDRCTGGQSRLNVMLEGCGVQYNGATLLTLVVEDLIGETVDHLAMVDLAGFQDAVDAIGGYEICVDNPVRDSRANLELPAGCTLASGDQTLGWLRSRSTQELTANGWQVMAGMNDLARNERQRTFMIDMMGQLSDFGSPQSMASTAQSIAPFVTVDSKLSLTEAVDIAWALRGMGRGAVRELDVPVYDFTTEEGAAVLLASIPVDEIVAGFVTPETAEDDSTVAG